MSLRRSLTLSILAASLLLPREARGQDDFRTLGAADAPVRMKIYSDFECPFCRNFALAAMPAIEAEFIDTGLVRLEYIFFPLSTVHPNAIAAARAAYCAGTAGRFWAYHDYLFVRQPEWRGTTATDSLWTAYAEKLGIGTGPFAECIASDESLDAVEADWLDAINAGAPGTPTIVVNGESIADLSSYDELAERIRAAVAAAGGPTSSQEP